MRVVIHADSVSTVELRAAIREFRRIRLEDRDNLPPTDLGELIGVGLNGPEGWTFTTPHLTAEQATRITTEMARAKRVFEEKEPTTIKIGSGG